MELPQIQKKCECAKCKKSVEEQMMKSLSQEYVENQLFNLKKCTEDKIQYQQKIKDFPQNDFYPKLVKAIDLQLLKYSSFIQIAQNLNTHIKKQDQEQIFCSKFICCRRMKDNFDHGLKRLITCSCQKHQQTTIAKNIQELLQNKKEIDQLIFLEVKNYNQLQTLIEQQKYINEQKFNIKFNIQISVEFDYFADQCTVIDGQIELQQLKIVLPGIKYVKEDCMQIQNIQYYQQINQEVFNHFQKLRQQEVEQKEYQNQLIKLNSIFKTKNLIISQDKTCFYMQEYPNTPKILQNINSLKIIVNSNNCNQIDDLIDYFPQNLNVLIIKQGNGIYIDQILQEKIEKLFNLILLQKPHLSHISIEFQEENQQYREIKRRCSRNRIAAYRTLALARKYHKQFRSDIINEISTFYS